MRTNPKKIRTQKNKTGDAGYLYENMADISSYKWDEISAAVFAAAFATALLLFISRTRYLAQRKLYVFCRDNDWRLFVVNLQSQTKERNTLLGNILTDFEIGALLDKYRNQPILERAMEKPHSLVPYVPQFLEVKYILKRHSGWKLCCVVKLPNGSTSERYYPIHGYADEDALLLDLERLKSNNYGTPSKFCLPVSFLVSLGLVLAEWAFLFLSLPSVGILPPAARMIFILTYIIPLAMLCISYNQWF